MIPYWMQYSLRLMHAAPGSEGGEVPATPPADPGSAPAEEPAVESEQDDPVLDSYLDGTAEGTPNAAPPTALPTPAEPKPDPAPPVVPPVEPSKEPVQPPPPAPTQPAPAPAAVAPAPQPSPEPVAPPPPAPSPAPVAPPPPAPSPEETTKAREAERTKYLDELERAYQVPDADKDLLLTSPEVALPKLAARVHLQVAESVIGSVMQNLPQLIKQVNTQESQARELEEVYYGMWPQLKDQAGKETTNRIMQAYYQAAQIRGEIPKREQAMREVGITVMTLLQRQIVPPSGNGQQPPATSPAPAFVPAGPGGAGPVPGQRPQLGVWGQLAEEFIEEDR